MQATGQSTGRWARSTQGLLWEFTRPAIAGLIIAVVVWISLSTVKVIRPDPQSRILTSVVVVVVFLAFVYFGLRTVFNLFMRESRRTKGHLPVWTHSVVLPAYATFMTWILISGGFRPLRQSLVRLHYFEDLSAPLTDPWRFYYVCFAALSLVGAFTITVLRADFMIAERLETCSDEGAPSHPTMILVSRVGGWRRHVELGARTSVAASANWLLYYLTATFSTISEYGSAPSLSPGHLALAYQRLFWIAVAGSGVSLSFLVWCAVMHFAVARKASNGPVLWRANRFLATVFVSHSVGLMIGVGCAIVMRVISKSNSATGISLSLVSLSAVVVFLSWSRIVWMLTPPTGEWKYPWRT